MLEDCEVRSWLPKGNDNDRTYKNDAKTMVNASLSLLCRMLVQTYCPRRK